MIGDIQIVHEHVDHSFGRLRYVLRYAVVFSEVQQALIQTHRLYDHVVFVEKYETIHLKDIVGKTLTRRFITPVQRSTYREQLDDAIAKLKKYLEYTAAPNPDNVSRV